MKNVALMSSAMKTIKKTKQPKHLPCISDAPKVTKHIKNLQIQTKAVPDLSDNFIDMPK